MTKQIISQISKSYAGALFEIASSSNSYDYIKNQLFEIKNTLESNEDLRIVMNNSSISNSKKNEILDSIFEGKIDNKLLSFMKILIKKERLKEFASIVTAYENMLDTYTNRKEVEIISSIELNENYKQQVLQALRNKLKCGIEIEWNVDESIIAGLIFKFDDYIIDTSVKSKLENLSKNISR